MVLGNVHCWINVCFGNGIMTDFNTKLDEVIFDLNDLSYASFATREEADRVADTLDYKRAEAKQAIIDLIDKELIGEDERFVITEEDVQELHGNNYFFDNELDVDYSIFLDDKLEQFEVGYLKDIPFFSYHNADRLIKNKQRKTLKGGK